jgi:hypothetical protein
MNRVAAFAYLLVTVVLATVAVTRTYEWKVGMDRTQSIILGDTALLKWTTTSDVWEFPTQSAYVNCNFGSANRICGTGVNQCAIKPTSLGTRYFGCKVTGRCANGQKVRLMGF